MGAIIMMTATSGRAGQSDTRFKRARQALLETLRAEGISNPDVLEAIGTVPRHEFVDEGMQWNAYDNKSLPIGMGQTISQPYVVARMTELALADEHCTKVLEVGTGCGYQTAVLAELVPEVYTIERIKSLHETARRRLRRMGHISLRFAYGDGYAGWEEKAPFEAIIVTAAAPSVPQALIQQLTVGGRLVIPVGKGKDQSLQLIQRWEEGFTKETFDPVTFVPLVPSLG